jgi:hypothetical protein
VRLRFAAVALSALALLAGLVSALAASERHSATVAAWQKAEPLVVDAQAIDTSLSDADTTAAGSFLQGRLEPAALRARYSSDLAQASAMLASAAQQVGSDPAVDASIRSLTVELPIYTGLVETATFNERQASYPLAAAYLGEANSLMRSELLPAAASLYEVEGQRLTANESSSSSTWPVMLAALLFVLLLVLLVVAQRWLSTHFRRTLNVPLVAATAVILVLAIWFTVALAAQGSGVHSGSAPSRCAATMNSRCSPGTRSPRTNRTTRSRWPTSSSSWALRRRAAASQRAPTSPTPRRRSPPTAAPTITYASSTAPVI